MPPKPATDQTTILTAAVDLVRQAGLDSLNARSLAKRLGVSTTPILSHFKTMAALKTAVLDEFWAEVRGFVDHSWTGETYLNLLIGFVIYSWRHPQAYRCLDDRILTGPENHVVKAEVLAAMRLSRRFSQTSEGNLQEAYSKMVIFCHGLGDLGARGLLYQPSEEGITAYVVTCLTALTEGDLS